MTFESLAITAFVIFLPTQCSSTALLATSTSGSSGMVVFFGALLWAHSESCFSGLQRLEDKKIGRNLGFNLGLTRGWAWVSWVRFVNWVQNHMKWASDSFRKKFHFKDLSPTVLEQKTFFWLDSFAQSCINNSWILKLFTTSFFQRGFRLPAIPFFFPLSSSNKQHLQMLEYYYIRTDGLPIYLLISYTQPSSSKKFKI